MKPLEIFPRSTFSKSRQVLPIISYMRLFLFCLSVFTSDPFAEALPWARRQHTRHGSQVCISVAAFEEPDWIDAIVANVRKFTDDSTKVALHLDSKTDYDEARVQGWISDKVVVTPERVSTQVFHGGVLYAHLLNAKTLAKEFHNQCSYFVMAASNMFWVRRGMEDYVRERELSVFRTISCNFNPYICDHPIMLDMVGGDRNRVAWSQPEGLYMPMSMVLDFAAYLDGWIAKNNWNVTEKIVLERGHFEEFWLQTWVSNNIKNKAFLASHDVKESRPLSYRRLGDGVTMEQVQDVMTGKLPHFAVKRVKRNLDNPVFKYIKSLSIETPQLH